MPREKESYRDNLERLDMAFPGRELLTINDVSVFLGINYRTVKKWYEFRNNRISKATLARMLS